MKINASYYSEHVIGIQIVVDQHRKLITGRFKESFITRMNAHDM